MKHYYSAFIPLKPPLTLAFMLPRSQFAPGTVIVDDGDPNALYTCTDGETWLTGGALGYEFNGTTHGTNSSACELTYTFSGTSVAVYGTIPVSGTDGPALGTTSRYFIDNSTLPSSTYTARLNTSIAYQQLFFQSAPLSDGTHSLSVSLTGNNMVGDPGRFFIDFFIITPQTNSALTDNIPSIFPSSTTTAMTDSDTIITIHPSSRTFTSVIASTVTVTPEPRKGSSTHTGAVVGGVLGSVILLTAIIGIAFFFLRNRRPRTDQAETGLPRVLPFMRNSNSIAVSPFLEGLSVLNQSQSTDLTPSPADHRQLPPIKTPNRALRNSSGGVTGVVTSESPPPY